eukprot:1608627-Prymnesium_polylepis.2
MLTPALRACGAARTLIGSLARILRAGLNAQSITDDGGIGRVCGQSSWPAPTIVAASPFCCSGAGKERSCSARRDKSTVDASTVERLWGCRGTA